VSVARKITIREVAHLAAVSIGTVSNVLNGATNVSEATRRRVEQVIQDLGFTPDTVARSLIARRRRKSSENSLTRQYVVLAETQGLASPDDTVVELLTQILDDGALGATRHLHLAHRLLIHMAQGPTSEDVKWRTISATAEFIAATRGADAPLVSNAIAWLMTGIAATPAERRAERLSERASLWQVRARERLERLIEVAVAVLGVGAHLVLQDYSGTVAAIVERLHEKGLKPAPILLESRATAGGIRYVNQFLPRGIDLRLAPDAAMEHVLGAASAVLLGCESMRCDGSVVNSLGSRPLARIAKALEIPVYCCAELFKFDRRSYAGAFDISAARVQDFALIDEITVPEGARVDAAVPAVEIVPAEFLTAIITEEGPLPPAALWARGHALFVE